LQTQGAAGSAPDGEDEDVYDTVADDAPGPLDLLSRATEARALGECMDKLGALQRQSLALAFYQGLSHAEVAEQLRQPLGTVKSWVRRALLTLKSCLQAPWCATGEGLTMDYRPPPSSPTASLRNTSPDPARPAAAPLREACCRRIRCCAKRPAPGKRG
jgi:hypothetical protein